MSVRAARVQGEALAASIGENKLPIDVEKIAKHLGLQVIRQDLGADVSGLLITGQGSAIIAVHESQIPTRQRFTIAHEIGHHVMGHQFGDGQVHVDHGFVITPRNSRSETGADPKEVEANQFAAALLMPSTLIEREIIERGMTPLMDTHVQQLAVTFSVSEQAMTIRLSSLGYL